MEYVIAQSYNMDGFHFMNTLLIKKIVMFYLNNITELPPKYYLFRKNRRIALDEFNDDFDMGKGDHIYVHVKSRKKDLGWIFTAVFHTSSMNFCLSSKYSLALTLNKFNDISKLVYDSGFLFESGICYVSKDSNDAGLFSIKAKLDTSPLIHRDRIDGLRKNEAKFKGKLWDIFGYTLIMNDVYNKAKSEIDEKILKKNEHLVGKDWVAVKFYDPAIDMTGSEDDFRFLEEYRDVFRKKDLIMM